VLNFTNLAMPLGTGVMKKPADKPAKSAGRVSSKVASELNNLIQIISGTSALIENIWEGTEGSEKYFAMLRASIERAERVTAQLATQAGGVRTRVQVRPALEKKPPASPHAEQATSRKPSLLIVDDEPMALTLLRQILTDAGYDVTIAQSGFKCLDLFQREPLAYDVVFLDLSMPFMDGEETFQRLQRFFSRVDVVLMAGFIDKNRLERMMNAGLRGFLAKPFGAEEILALTKSVTGSKGSP
jgi:CheY-like chemotaxis protein